MASNNHCYPGLAPCEMKFDFRELIRQKDDVIHDYRKKKYESLVGGQFSIEQGHVEFVDAHTVEVSGKHLTGERILIATGSRSVIPPDDKLARGSLCRHFKSEPISAGEQTE